MQISYQCRHKPSLHRDKPRCCLAFPLSTLKLPSLSNPLVYLTVLTNCLYDFWLGSLSLLHIPSCCGLQIWPALRHIENGACCGSKKVWLLTGDRRLQAQAVSRAWDSSMVGNLSSASSSVQMIRTLSSSFAHMHTSSITLRTPTCSNEFSDSTVA